MSEERLSNQTAIVTGASSGIGRATSKVLAENGANVVLSARTKESLRIVAQEIRNNGGTALVAPTDVRSHKSVESTVDMTVNEFGGIDVVVSNAGTVHEAGKSAEDISVDTFERVMETNAYGSFFVTKYSLPYLRESEGTLVFVGSAAANAPRPRLSVYAASKWWLSGFARSIEAEAGEDGVSVSVINPSEVATPIGSEDELHEDKDDEAILSPTDVADAIHFIATRDPPASVSELNLYRRDKLHYLFD